MLFAYPQDGLALDPLLILFAALLLDAFVGDMKPLFNHVPHPVELVGRAIAWFDHRRPSNEVLVLTRLGTAGEWLRLTDFTSEVKTKNDERLPVTQVLVPQGDTWILLSGCAATAEGSGLVLRVFDGKALSAPKFLTLKAPATP